MRFLWSVPDTGPGSYLYPHPEPYLQSYAKMSFSLLFIFDVSKNRTHLAGIGLLSQGQVITIVLRVYRLPSQ
jgi:hypothetical protein